MQWTLNQKGWRAALVKMALLTALWLIITFIFAEEIYLSTRGAPINISWFDAAVSAFHDWFPWILLSPVAVLLAAKFRFERRSWRRSLIVHLASCVIFTAAYQGMLILADPGPVFLTTAGAGMVTGMAPEPPPGLPDVGFANGFAAKFAPPSPSFSGTNTFFIQRGIVTSDSATPAPFPANPGTVTIVRGAPPFAPPASRAQLVFGTSFLPNRWAHFLHMAMMRTQFTIPIYWCIVCICWAIGHFQEAGERERRTLELETRLTQANLDALKMQLQPHFLFNTLNAISSLVHENPAAADDMIGSLSQFLRTTLDVAAKNEIPLRSEIEFVDRYLEIQQTRFGERLKICREIEPWVMDALVPPLIFQPLVENAIRHGIESQEGGGTVTIRAQLKGDSSLFLEISDDGKGFSGGQLLKHGNGVGLSNTEARLQALYGDKHQFKLTANHPTGASVKIEIPFLLSKSKFNGQNQI